MEIYAIILIAGEKVSSQELCDSTQSSDSVISAYPN